MKKIKAKITNEYNRYLSIISKKKFQFFKSLKLSKNVNNKIYFFKRYIFKEIKKISTYLIRLKFMKNKKIAISVFNRYLILSIFLLFSYLFYLSIPSFYNYDKLQKDLSEKINNEFNLNASLSANIVYKMLPSPNFEISNVILNTVSGNNFEKFAEVKKMKIYIYQSNLHMQKMMEIKKIVFLNSNFNINSNSYNYINNFINNKLTNKKIEIKKSKIFFTDKKSKKDAVAITSINDSIIYFDSENNSNKLTVKGSIFNNNFDYNFIKNFNNINESITEINFHNLNIDVKNDLTKIENNKKNYKGSSNIIFLGSDINVNYEIKDKLILLSTDKSYINGGRKISFKGDISTRPFFFDINVELDSVDLIKLIKNLHKLKNLFTKKIFLNDNFSGKLLIKVHNIDNFKLFNKANFFLKFINGELIIDGSNLISNKIGKISFMDSKLIEKNNEQFIKSSILFEINNQKKFYQKIQVSRENRIKLKNIYLELNKKIDNNDFKVSKFIINSNTKNNSFYKTINITDIIDINVALDMRNWIELKNYINKVFSEIN